jgi:hypothetical protein
MNFKRKYSDKKMWFAIFYTWHLAFDVKTNGAGTAYPS